MGLKFWEAWDQRQSSRQISFTAKSFFKLEQVDYSVILIPWSLGPFQVHLSKVVNFNKKSIIFTPKCHLLEWALPSCAAPHELGEWGENDMGSASLSVWALPCVVVGSFLLLAGA